MVTKQETLYPEWCFSPPDIILQIAVIVKYANNLLGLFHNHKFLCCYCILKLLLQKKKCFQKSIPNAHSTHNYLVSEPYPMCYITYRKQILKNWICLHFQVERLEGSFSYSRMACSVWYTRCWTESKSHVNTMQDLKFSQQCCWRFKSSETWQGVTLNCLTLKCNTLCYFRKLATTHQTKQQHVLEVLKLQVILSFQCFPAASRYFYWLQFAIQMNMYLQRTLITFAKIPTKFADQYYSLHLYWP